MTARDIRYGRRGGGWVDHRPGELLAGIRRLRARLQAEGRWAEPVDRTRLLHPETIATARAHRRDCLGGHSNGEKCPAQPDPDDLAEIWAGRARMAAVRRVAGQPLTDLDAEALERAERLSSRVAFASQRSAMDVRDAKRRSDSHKAPQAEPAPV